MTAFDKAFNFTMSFEVGSWFNPNDPEVIAGKCVSKDQIRKTGYSKTQGDSGGTTKFGIAQNSHPNVNVTNLNLGQAKGIYFNEYFIAGKCDSMPENLALVHFDACVNNGVGQAAKFLQKALGITVDGKIGNQTLEAIAKADQNELIKKYISVRRDFFSAIVKRKPDQNKFLNGWLNRCDQIEKVLNV